MLLVPASVNPKPTSKPETFSGKDAEWPRWSLTLRAYLEAVSGRMLALLRSAEDPEQRVNRVDFELGDDVLAPKFASRKMVFRQAVLTFSVGASEDPREGIDRLKHSSDSAKQQPRGKLTMTRGQEFFLRALAKGSEVSKKLGDHLVLNAYELCHFLR